MTDYDHRCGECGAITRCAVHDEYYADCVRDPTKCHEECIRNREHVVKQ